jgi:hypothetical protein
VGAEARQARDDLKAKALAALHRLQRLPRLVQSFSGI